MYIAAAVLSRRRYSRNSSPPPAPALPPAHSHRHPHSHRGYAPEPPSRSRSSAASKKLPPVKQTRATEVDYHSRNPSEDDAYAYAMAARARLHARLRAAPLETSTLRSLAPQEEHASWKYSNRPTGSRLSDAHTQGVTNSFRNSNASLTIDERLSRKLVCLKTSTEEEDLLSEPEVCSICLESFSMGKTVLCFPCKHRFHRSCLVAWLEGHMQCPNCRSVIIKVGLFQSSVEYFNALYSSHSKETRCKIKSRTQLLMN
ncbi:hypothetical protein L7F22_038555 [Adiantum nelumboides]|nr:hypothetical protein [Adiantum nelumboides]